MSAERVIANTLRLTQADLDAAELLHAGNNRYAVYHCEQAAEKIIKAVLTSEGGHANIKHQLDDMVRQVPDANQVAAETDRAPRRVRDDVIDAQRPAATSSHRQTTTRSIRYGQR